MAVFTLVVMTLSSTYCPVPSCVRVDAQPEAASRTVVARIAVSLVMVCMVELRGGDGQCRSRLEPDAVVLQPAVCPSGREISVRERTLAAHADAPGTS